MKKIMFVALALLVGLASCVKDKQYPGITISNVSYTPKAVQADDDVTVTATITSFKDFTAKLVYKTDEANKAIELAMTAGADNLYTAVIPAQPDSTKVTFHIEAMNEEASAISDPEMSYIVGGTPIDYSKLRLNELNGQDHKKFIEIYNAGTEPINMNGVTIFKDTEKLVWIGKSAVKIEAGAYLLLISEDVFVDYPEIDTTLFMFHSGLSAKKNVRIELKMPTTRLLIPIAATKMASGTMPMPLLVQLMLMVSTLFLVSKVATPPSLRHQKSLITTTLCSMS